MTLLAASVWPSDCGWNAVVIRSVGEAHQLLPEQGGEHRVPVRHDGLGDGMKVHDLREERLCYGLRRVRVGEGDEVTVLAEPIHYRQDDGFASHLGQSFDEVDVRPDCRWHWQRKK
jgi:hypothetical protein